MEMWLFLWKQRRSAINKTSPKIGKLTCGGNVTEEQAAVRFSLRCWSAYCATGFFSSGHIFSLFYTASFFPVLYPDTKAGFVSCLWSVTVLWPSKSLKKFFVHPFWSCVCLKNFALNKSNLHALEMCTSFLWATLKKKSPTLCRICSKTMMPELVLAAHRKLQ